MFTRCFRKPRPLLRCGHIRLIGSVAKSNYDLFTQCLDKFPVSLVVSAKKGVPTSIKMKELIDYVEKLNIDHNNDPKVDPNRWQLLLDYQLLKSGTELDQYLVDGGCQALAIEEQLMLVQFTEYGFRHSTAFMHKFEDQFVRLFDLPMCILNASKFPILAKVQTPTNSEIQEENATMEDNLYILASLGLVKVSKRRDGTLVLTK